MAATTDNDVLLIGASLATYAPAPSAFFAGVIDELTYYATALTDDEVADLHDPGSRGKYVFP